MAHLLPLPKLRFFDASGEPLAGGKLYSYAAGTSTLQATYTDQSGSVANANPVVLDANGEASVWIGDGSYKLVLKDSADVAQWTVDGVAHINDLSITTAKIADGALSADVAGRAKMADGFITTAKFAADAEAPTVVDDGITTAKIADGAITQAKRADLGLQLSPAITFDTTTKSSEVTVTDMTVTITTTGRPVLVACVPDGEAATSTIFGPLQNTPSASAQSVVVRLKRDGTTIARYELSSGAGGTIAIPSSAMWTIDPVSGGTYTYTVTIYCASTATRAAIYGTKLVAYEL